MNLSALVVLIIFGSSAAAPVVDEDFYKKLSIIYTSQHDIVNLFIAACSSTNEICLFFIEADQTNELITYQGLHVMKFSKGKNITKLLLANGKDVTCDADNIYIGATDGIYKFDDKEIKAEKYGTVTENIRNIAKVNGSDLFYILTENNKLYRVTENGTKMTLDDTIVDAQQIVLDLAHNLYYYTSDKELWVISGGVKTKFEGLPKDKIYVKLLKPPTQVKEGVPVVINNDVFKIDPNGLVQAFLNASIIVKPSAYSVEVGFIQFFGHNKRIYLYNVILDIIEVIGKAILNDHYSKH